MSITVQANWRCQKDFVTMQWYDNFLMTPKVTDYRISQTYQKMAKVTSQNFRYAWKTCNLTCPGRYSTLQPYRTTKKAKKPKWQMWHFCPHPNVQLSLKETHYVKPHWIHRRNVHYGSSELEESKRFCHNAMIWHFLDDSESDRLQYTTDI